MKPFYKDSTFWTTAAVCGFLAAAMGTCMYKFDEDRDAWVAKQKAHKAHIRATCTLLERNRPGKSGTYDTYQCGGVVEWLKRDWGE